MLLRKPTQWLRVVLDQNGQAQVDNQPTPGGGPVLEAEADAPAGTYRRVVLCVPSEPRVVVSLTTSPTEAGPSRTGYKFAPVPADKAITIHLQPNQALYMSADQGGGFAVCSLIVEYLEGGS